MSTLPALGLRPTRYDQRTLRMAKYTGFMVPAPPVACDWSVKVQSWPMYSNDTIGDCAIAGPAHQVQAWTANDGIEIVPSEQTVLDDYSRCSGWVRDNPVTDVGCVLLDVMKIWRNKGLVNTRIGAYALVDPGNPVMIRGGIHLFGGLCIGLSLPAAIQNADVWDIPGRARRGRGQWAAGTWGGHCVELVAYDLHWLTCVTWGKLLKLSYEFLADYCTEAYACISRDWLGPDSKAPNGFDAITLMKDLKQLH